MPCLKIHQQKVQYPQIALFLWILQHCICCVRFPTSVESYTFLIPKNSKRKSALLWWCHETFWCVEEIRTETTFILWLIMAASLARRPPPVEESVWKKLNYIRIIMKHCANRRYITNNIVYYSIRSFWVFRCMILWPPYIRNAKISFTGAI